MKPSSKTPVLLALTILCASVIVPCMAQRKITPVRPTPGTTTGDIPRREKDPKANVAEMHDAEGNIVFVDTVTGQEWVDTTATKADKRMQYPLYESLTFGVNLWDPVMRIFGQKYGGIDVWAELSLHNRYKPVIEFGLGQSEETPDGKNFTYHTSLSPYVRIGMNYNIFYNNSPDYQLVVGVRYGFTTFRYQVRDVTLAPGYWDEPMTFDMPRQSSTAGFFEFVAGVRVKIIKPISLGWTIKYHALLHESKSEYGRPMYIPGFGKRGGAFSGSFSVIYTLPLNKPAKPEVNTETDN